MNDYALALQKATKLTDQLLGQYQDYMKITGQIDELKSSQMNLAIELGAKTGKSFAQILEEQPHEIKGIASKIAKAERDQQRVSDEMTFANPVVWMMYKFKAYAGTSTAIVDMEDFRKHCTPDGYICTTRFRFLRQYLLDAGLPDLNDVSTYPNALRLEKVYQLPELLALGTDPKFKKLWDEHEYHTENGRVAKWEDYARTIQKA